MSKIKAINILFKNFKMSTTNILNMTILNEMGDARNVAWDRDQIHFQQIKKN